MCSSTNQACAPLSGRLLPCRMREERDSLLNRAPGQGAGLCAWAVGHGDMNDRGGCARAEPEGRSCCRGVVESAKAEVKGRVADMLADGPALGTAKNT